MYSLPCLVNVQNLDSLEDTIIQIKTILQRDRGGNGTDKSGISTVRREPQSCSLGNFQGVTALSDLRWLLLPSPSHNGSADHSTSSWVTTASPTLIPHRVFVDAISNIQHEWICQSVCSWAVSKGREAGPGGGRTWGRKLDLGRCVGSPKNDGLHPELWCYQFFLCIGFRELWIHFLKHIRGGENYSGCAFDHNVITTFCVRELG